MAEVEGLSQVRAEHKFDEASLHEYLKKHLSDFPRGDGRLAVLQYRFVFDLLTCEQGSIRPSCLQVCLHTRQLLINFTAMLCLLAFFNVVDSD